MEARIKHYYQDIRDIDSLRRIVREERPDFVFHLAAQPIVSKSYIDPLDTITSNVVGTANVLEALRSLASPCSAVIITSDKCYDNVEWTWGYRENDPLGGKDPYSASKGAAELMVKTYFHSFFSKPDSQVKLISVRAGNVIGGGDWAVDRIVPDCIRAWVSGELVEVRNPKATRPWQHVLEPLSGYLRGAQMLIQFPERLNGESYNFGPGADQSYSVQHLLEKLSSYWKVDSLKERFTINSDQHFHEAGLLKLNCDKALHDLKWKPVFDFGASAEYTAKWYREYYDMHQDLYGFTIDQIERYTALARAKQLAWTE